MVIQMTLLLTEKIITRVIPQKIVSGQQRLSNITTLEEISSHHFIISDPNPDNITFSNNYKFVDTYSFLLSKKHIDEAIFVRNLIKVNISVLSGLLEQVVT